MKANELMVSDLLYHKANDYYGEVTGVIDNGEIYLDGVIAYIDDCTPIPITPEILEKNGFVKELDSDGIHYRFTLIQGCSQFSLLYARSVFQWLYPIDFKYVHEFQHALKLCGIEKTIEL